MCKSKNISAKYQHCGIHPGKHIHISVTVFLNISWCVRTEIGKSSVSAFTDGVRNLDCFSKYKRDPNCTWEPGKRQRKSEKLYTLIFQQP